nr:protein transport protein SEC24-like CEF [Tanacetum cinerariifolium]
MLYRSECWPITKALTNRMKVVELRMLRWTCGKTLLDMIPNGVYRAQLEVETIINKMREGRLRWFGHVRRRPQSLPVKRVEALVVDGLRRRGRLKLRWEDRVKHDMKELLLSEDMTSDRNEWRARISLSRETFVDNGFHSSPWLMHVIHTHVDFSIDNALLVSQKEFRRIRVIDLLDSIPELLHKDFRDFYNDNGCLEAREILDYINDNLKCFFLLLHSGFQSNIGRAYLDPFCR